MIQVAIVLFDREHRLVYQISNETIIILQCRYHY
ncbi:type II toxin-antitoxin system YoeB family toxin [Pistricoccus aurantiacus]